MVSKKFAKEKLCEAVDALVATLNIDVNCSSEYDVQGIKNEFMKLIDNCSDVDIADDITLKKLLESKGYAVIKLTQEMKDDMNQCVDLDSSGESKDCDSCTDHVCLLNI